MPSSKFVIGGYSCDFGNVLQGGVKRKAFKARDALLLRLLSLLHCDDRAFSALTACLRTVIDCVVATGD